MKENSDKIKKDKVIGDKIDTIVKERFHTLWRDKCVSQLSEQTSESFNEMMEAFFHKTIDQWWTKVEEAVSLTTVPAKKLHLYEEEIIRIKRSIDSIDKVLNKHSGEEIKEVITRNLNSIANKKFLEVFLEQFNGSDIKVDVRLSSLMNLNDFQTIGTSKISVTFLEYRVHIGKTTSGSAKQKLFFTVNKDSLNETIQNGFNVDIPIAYFFINKRAALKQYASKIDDHVKNIRFFQSDIKSKVGKEFKPLKRRGFKWLDESMFKDGSKINQLKDLLVEEGFIKPIDSRHFKNIFKDEIKIDSEYIDWQNSSDTGKYQIQKGDGAISFMLYFMYLITEENKLATKQRNYIPYLESCFKIESKSVLDYTNVGSIHNTYPSIKRQVKSVNTQKQWMKTMRMIFRIVFK